MKPDRRTREQRKADASARTAAVCFLLLGLCAVVALTTDAGGTEQEAPAVPVVEEMIEEKPEAEGTPADGCAYLDVGEPLSEFVLTAYCPCSRCCGKWADGITSTGTTATEGRTVAVDPSVIPYGSIVTVFFENGDTHSYIAEDCGGGIKQNRIDIFFNDHQAALEFGVQSAMVYVEVNE